MKLRIVSLLLSTGALLGSCATRQVTFLAKEQDVKISLALTDLKNPDVDAKVIGQLPQTLSLEELDGKAIKMSAADYSSQLWVFPNLPGDENTATVSLIPIPRTPADPKAGAAGVSNGKDSRQRNLVTRVLLRAYQALSSKRYNLAIELSKKASELDPELSGPLIIEGLASLQIGNREEAKVAFTKGLSLDPDDAQLQTLVKSLP